MRIVIVDDHVLMRRGLAHIVEHGIPGVDVVEAGNASAALAAMRQETADVALIDVRLPDLDGLELLRAMKREWPTVPVIMLSTHENAPYVKRALSDGPVDRNPERSALIVSNDKNDGALKTRISHRCRGDEQLPGQRNALRRELTQPGHPTIVRRRSAIFVLAPSSSCLK